MSLAAGVLDQDHLAGADDAALAVAGRDLHAAVEVDDVLAARGGVPIEIVVAGGLAENDAGGLEPLGIFAEFPLLDPLHLDVAEMRFALRIDEDVVNAHARALPRCQFPMSVAGGDSGASLARLDGPQRWHARRVLRQAQDEG